MTLKISRFFCVKIKPCGRSDVNRGSDVDVNRASAVKYRTESPSWDSDARWIWPDTVTVGENFEVNPPGVVHATKFQLESRPLGISLEKFGLYFDNTTGALYGTPKWVPKDERHFTLSIRAGNGEDWSEDFPIAINVEKLQWKFPVSEVNFRLQKAQTTLDDGWCELSHELEKFEGLSQHALTELDVIKNTQQFQDATERFQVHAAVVKDMWAEAHVECVGCKDSVARNMVAGHSKKCMYCFEIHPCREIVEHEEICSRRPATCENPAETHRHEAICGEVPSETPASELHEECCGEKSIVGDHEGSCSSKVDDLRKCARTDQECIAEASHEAVHKSEKDKKVVAGCLNPSFTCAALRQLIFSRRLPKGHR